MNTRMIRFSVVEGERYPIVETCVCVALFGTAKKPIVFDIVLSPGSH